MADYQVILTTDAGVRLQELDGFLSLEASKTKNKAGYFSMQLPPSFNTDLIQPDRLIQVWRQPRGGRLKLFNVYMLRRWIFSTQGANEQIEIAGPDMLDLLRRRIVAAYSASSQASKIDNADDMMKEIVTESLVNGVSVATDAGTRVWSNLSVAGDLTLGPSITKSGIAFDTLLTKSGQGVLAQINKASKEEGTEVFFDIVPNVVSGNSITFRFETYTGQIGQDVSDRVIFSQNTGNLENPSLEYDYEDEINYVYATGQGEQDQRNVQQVYDATRYNQSIWGRIEAEADSRNQDSDNAVIAAGNDKLNDGRPRIRFTATPIDTEGTRFGIHWGFGDKIQAVYRNIQFYSLIDTVSVSVDSNSNETINAKLSFEGAI